MELNPNRDLEHGFPTCDPTALRYASRSDLWFTASLLFISERERSPNEQPLWEEQIVLIESLDESNADAKAAAYGRANEHEYVSKDGQTVRWVFRKVERICPVETLHLQDGTELFSRFLKGSEVQSLSVPFED